MNIQKLIPGADNTSAIQAMLDECGIVMIDRPGKYFISKTLIIHSNTRLVLSPGAELIAAPMSRCALIENQHFRGGGKDKNIGIIGGTWDGNCDAQGYDAVYQAKHRLDNKIYSPDFFTGKLLRFCNLDNFCMEKMTVKDPVSYGIQIGVCTGFVVRDIVFDYNCNFGTTDGVHIQGDCYHGVIENLSGVTNDDMVSLTPIDECHAECCRGNIANIVIRNICADNGYSGVRLLACGGCTTTNITVSGVYGTYRHNAVLITNHHLEPGSRSYFDDITVEHVHASKNPVPLSEEHFTFWDGGSSAIERWPVVWVGYDIEIGKLTLRDISRHERAKTNAPLVYMGKSEVKIGRLYAENIAQTMDKGISAPAFISEATVGELIMHDVQVSEISPETRAMVDKY